MNKKSLVFKLLLLLTFLLAEPSGFASDLSPSLLTVKSGNFTFTHPETSSLSSPQFQSFAEDFVATLSTFAYPKVPKAILEQVQSKQIRFEFVPMQMTQNGRLLDQLGPNGEFIIQLKLSLLKVPALKSRIIHEWFHVLHRVVHPNESNWVKEGLAQTFVSMTADDQLIEKYPGEGLLLAINQSTTELKFPFDQKDWNQEAYGHTFLYFYYLFQKCGGETLFWKLVQGVDGGGALSSDEQNIDTALKDSDSSKCRNFKNSAVQAEIAEFGPQVAREHVGRINFGGARRDFCRRKGAHRIAQHLDGVAMVEAQLAEHFTILTI
jgi:hypothetical protein